LPETKLAVPHVEEGIQQALNLPGDECCPLVGSHVAASEDSGPEVLNVVVYGKQPGQDIVWQEFGLPQLVSERPAIGSQAGNGA
jgi:hypothetical protein